LRKFLQILGVLFLVLFSAAVVGFGLLAYKGHQYDTQSKAYVDTALPAIAFNWDPQVLTGQAAPELFAAADQTARDNFFYQLSLLGPMQRYDGSAGGANMDYNAGHMLITAIYTAHGKFRDGEATFHILVVKRGGQWQIAGFHVDPP
jgi:hypothetical protein